MNVKVPGRPGKYSLELDMVDDGVRWFHSLDEAPVQQEVIVSFIPFLT